MQNLGAKVNRHTTQATLKEEEVSANSISSVNIEDTLKIINNLEENLSEDTIS